MSAHNTETLLAKLSSEVKHSFSVNRSILSFKEYLDLVGAHPKRHLRSSAQYAVDMIDHYGTTLKDFPTGSLQRFNVFDAPFSNGEGKVVGQERVQSSLYRIFSNFAREGRINKLVLLHGPNGSAKSSLVKCLMGGLEAYSNSEEGAVYTFSWVFPSEKLQNSGIGFGSDTKKKSGEESYAHLDAALIDARVPSELKDHPMFLFPIEMRQKILEDLSHSVEDAGFSISDYLRHGGMSYKSKKIYDALLAEHEGDLAKVLKYVQVERYYLSRRYRAGLATIEPQMSVDARLQQVTADRSLAALPKALHHLALYEPSGALVDANRGILEFADLLKRPVEAFKYLLATVETATVSMESFLLVLDMLFVASTNETYLDAFKEHPDFASFKGRMELVKVPYVLRWSDECSIYAPQINDRVVGRHVAPHAIKVAALWAVLTRMRRCAPALYSGELKNVIENLSPMEKVLLFDSGQLPDKLSSRLKKELAASIEALYREGQNYPNYEGRFGASAREIRNALLNAAHHHEYSYLGPLAVFDEIKDIIKAKSDYDFLKQEVVSGYHDHVGFLKHTEREYLNWIDDEVRESMGLAPENSYSDLFSKYVNHVSHWVKSEQLYDAANGQYHDPDKKFMAEVEVVLMGQNENTNDFRNAVIGAIGARSLDKPDEKPNYDEIFGHHIARLKEDFYAKRQKVLSKNIDVFLRWAADDDVSLDAKHIEQAELMMHNLKERYGYNKESAKDTVAYLLKMRYSKEMKPQSSHNESVKERED